MPTRADMIEELRAFARDDKDGRPETERLDYDTAERLLKMFGYDIPEGDLFDLRLARTPYFVLPKLAIQAMPVEWQRRLEALLREMEAAGINRTPQYTVFLTDDGVQTGQVRNMALDRGDYDPANAYWVFVNGKIEDPWANYRHGRIEDLCPYFTKEKANG